jgi:hypothetical protein
MLIVETIARVRRDHHILHKPIKQIARERGLSRNAPAGRACGRAGADAGGEPIQEPPRALMRMFEPLRAEGYDGGWATAYTAQVRGKLQDIAKGLGIIKPEKADAEAEPQSVFT